MKILRHPHGSPEKIADSLLSADLIYGDSPGYSSLISPCSVVLTPGELRSMDRDLLSMWNLYKTWIRLYRGSLAGEEPPWIAKFAEQGLSPTGVKAHRMTVDAGMEPRLCRLDYISLGSRRQIAEAQWKSGGPGLFFGFSDVCQRILPLAGTRGAGDAATRFADTIRNQGQDPSDIAVNVVRPGFLRGEKYLERTLGAEGVHYKTIGNFSVNRHLVTSPDGHILYDGDSKKRIHFLSTRGFTSEAPDELILALATANINDQIWIDTPFNCIYQQKWGLALPFMEEFGDQFDDHVRKVVIPTVLLTGDTFHLGDLVPHVDHPLREILLQPISLEDFVELPGSLRKMIVFKCGAGTGHYCSDSRGVFRIGGSRSTASRQLAFIVSRIVNLGEPWIAQPYIDEKYSVPLCAPSHMEDPVDVMAHGRFMTFGRRLPGQAPTTICSLANFAKNWKVTGKSAQFDHVGRMEGSAFADIRSESPTEGPPRDQQGNRKVSSC